MRTDHSPEEITSELLKIENSQWGELEGTDDFKLFLATRLVDTGQISSAINLLENLHVSDLYLDLYQHTKALTFILSNDVTAAASYIVALEEKHPDDRNTLYLKSAYLAHQQDLKGALDALSVGVKANKRDGALYLQRGLMHLLVFDHDQAIDDLKKAVRYLPKENENQKQQALLQLGLIYYKVKSDLKQAKRFIDKGVALNPNSNMVSQFKASMGQ